MTKAEKETKRIRLLAKRGGLSGETHLIACPGSAHSNAHIDNCGLCAPRWGEIEVPAEHATLEDWREFVAKTEARKTAPAEYGTDREWGVDDRGFDR